MAADDEREENKPMNNPWDSEKSVDNRYKNDPTFHALVDMLYVSIAQGQYTPSELREACMFASCLYEYQHVRPFILHRLRPWMGPF